MGLNHSKVKSFSYAIAGFKEAFEKEPNIRTHVLFAILTIVAAIVLDFTKSEWIILLFTIFFVLTLELVNTAIEALVNLISPEIKPEAKIAKDISASVVLLGAILAVVVGVILFVPKLANLI
jgi:diacylglycerol kinase